MLMLFLLFLFFALPLQNAQQLLNIAQLHEICSQLQLFLTCSLFQNIFYQSLLLYSNNLQYTHQFGYLQQYALLDSIEHFLIDSNPLQNLNFDLIQVCYNKDIMKYYTPFIFFALVVLIAADHIDPNYNYSIYCSQYGKNQTQAGRKNFQRNYQIYLDKRAQNIDVSINWMFDLDQQQSKVYKGRIKNKELAPSSRPTKSVGSLFLSPTSFDWRNLTRVTPVKNQGGCGSCWAFAATAQYESAMAIATNGTFYDLSQQYAVQCVNTSYGCGGGDELDAMIVYNTTGVPTEAAYPYKAQNNYYRNLGQNICSNTTTRVKLNVTNGGPVRYQRNTIQQIQSDLVQYGPPSVGVYASGQFGNPGSSGLVSCSTAPYLDHAILLVGYTTTHWIVKNSWGSGWGNGGYAYLSKTADCGMATDVVVLKAQYTPPPPPPPPPVVINITLTITMTDSGNNGWQGNKIGFRQNGVIVGQFGSTFTAGNSSGPITIVIDGKKQTEIVATVLGTNPNQVGFTIKYQNGTVVFTKTAAAYNALQIFNTFCALGGCPVPTIVLSINMTDSYGDGWQGTILSFKQNSLVVGTFGEGFSNNKTFGPVNVTIPGKYLTQIVTYYLGSYTQQIGFTIKAPNGTVVASRNSSQAFNATAVLGTFCPLSGCAAPPKVKYYVVLTSSCSGWGKNVLGIRQDGIIVANLTLPTGNTSAAIQVNLTQFTLAQVVVVTLGDKTWQIGFAIRTEVGTVICQRLPGSVYQANSILCSWTPGRGHEGLVYSAQTVNQNKIGLYEDVSDSSAQSNKAYMISTIVLAVLSGVLALALAISITKNIKYSKESNLYKGSQIESANTIQKHEVK